MLDDASIERWSRQILLPEVGGRGQARLLASRVRVVGHGIVAGAARDLLQRGGVRPDADDGDVVLDVGEPSTAQARTVIARGGVLVRAVPRGPGGLVWTLVGQPCGVCLAVPSFAPDTDAALDVVAAQALGALAANEVLCALLVRPVRGRGHRIDLAAGRYEAVVPQAAGACDVCGGRA